MATRNDFGTVQGLGHDTKGAGASFGFQTITDIGAALEAEAGNADTDASLRWVGELSTFLDGVGLDADLSGGPPPSDPREATTVARVDRMPATGAARRIVLVEDNDLLRDTFRELLQPSTSNWSNRYSRTDHLPRVPKGRAFE